TESDDTDDHQGLRDWLKISGADPLEAHAPPSARFCRHLRIAPKVTPRKRCFRSRNVKIATGSRKRNVPAAIVVQSGRPEPICEGIKGGAVCARRMVMISAKAYSFQAVMKQNTAVAAIR